MRLIKWIVSIVLLAGVALPAWAQRDPTEPVSYQAIAKSSNDQSISSENIIVKAVIHGRSRQLALIGDRYVGKGDEVDGAQIVAVTPGAVLFKDPATGENFTVEVFGDSIKTPVQSRGEEG